MKRGAERILRRGPLREGNSLKWRAIQRLLAGEAQICQTRRKYKIKADIDNTMVGGYQPIEGESDALYCTQFCSKSLYVELSRFELFQAQRFPAHVTFLAQDRWNTT